MMSGIMMRDDQNDEAHEFFVVKGAGLSRLVYDADGKLKKISCLNAVITPQNVDNGSISGNFC